ncbi:hypothetical protein YC2023_095809 [Brassica napus]
MKEKDERERGRGRGRGLCGEAIRPSEDETLVDLVFLFSLSHLQCRRSNCPQTFLTNNNNNNNNGVQNQVGELSFSFYF